MPFGLFLGLIMAVVLIYLALAFIHVEYGISLRNMFIMLRRRKQKNKYFVTYDSRYFPYSNPPKFETYVEVQDWTGKVVGTAYTLLYEDAETALYHAGKKADDIIKAIKEKKFQLSTKTEVL
jgi:hypothetical protein